MTSFLGEWASLLLRWFHVLAGIAWVGHAFFFHSIHQHMSHRRDPKDTVEGETWMIHGGGFYFMQKHRQVDTAVIDGLLWFKWEAGLTWLSGVLLLLVVFYLGGGSYLVDTTVADLDPRVAMAIGVGSVVVGFAVYDAIWAWLYRVPALGTALTVALVAGVAIGLSHTLSGRAAYIHTGALLGTIMAGNVWWRIIPGQRRMLAQLREGKLDPDFAARTSARSTHNGYMQFPVVFVMISNHYPSVYGHAWSWVLLLLVMVLGAAVRQLLFDAGRSHPVVFAALLGSAAPLAWLTFPRDAPPAAVVAGEAAPIDRHRTGTVVGRVTFGGVVPPPKELVLTGCKAEGPVFDDSLRVFDGALADAVVWIAAGSDRWQPPPPPRAEVVVDQFDCMYRPKVVGVRTGQDVTFVNSDDLVHNVRTVAGDNPVTNDVMTRREERLTRVFRKPEVAVTAKCDVHPWMTAYVAVFDHPWFAVTDRRGEFELSDVPEGAYTVAAWHPVAGRVEIEMTVATRTEARADFVLGGP